MIKYTNQLLRYEKGNFKSGYCLLKEQKIMIINKFFTTEGKINALLDILKNLELDTSRFTEKSHKLYEELLQSEVKL
jgi:predicted nuclease with TOPRIM domain